ncbi:MAG: PAS domain S-box protein [Candidatus Eremiobacterota bacterium]
MFQHVFMYAGIAMVIIDKNGYILDANLITPNILNYTREDVFQKHFSDFIYHEDVSASLRWFEQIISQKVTHTPPLEKRYISKDGTIIWGRNVYSAVNDLEGNVQLVVSTIQNIEQQKRAEEELQGTKDFLDKIINSVADPIFVKDSHNRWIVVNDAYCTLVGRTREELIDKSDYDFFIKSESDVFREKDELVLKTKEENYNEEDFTDAGGVYHLIATKRKCYTDKKGQDFIVGIIRDITENKKEEKELLRIEKLESLGILAGGIAHDFNNILTSILGNISLAELMVDSDEKDSLREVLTMAQEASLRARDLTRQLLTFSRGGAPVKKTGTITQLLKEITYFSLQGSNVRCEFNIPASIWNVEMDEEQISQAVQNLVINADQAMPEGGIIRIFAENVYIEETNELPLKTGRYVKISVKDHGPGIAREYLTKIFDPYFTTKQKGSGLGLATTYSIIKRHHGHITLESRTGEGTTFSFFLPASEKDFDVEEIKHPLKSHGKILVMDDDEMIRRLMPLLLPRLGYEVELAADGTEAIALYEKARYTDKPFDLVIMDLTIPGGMGGKEAIEKLLAMDPSVKAIVSSGYSNDPVMADCRDYGFKSVITKPYNVNNLGEILYKVLHETA